MGRFCGEGAATVGTPAGACGAPGRRVASALTGRVAPGLAVLAVLGLVGCSDPAPRSGTPAASTTAAPGSTTASPAPTTSAASAPAPAPSTSAPATPAGGATPAPTWLGTRVLAEAGVARPTPRALRDRRIVTEDLLPPPPDGRFRARVRRVPSLVAARSTWQSGCPVGLGGLRYVTVSFWGFDRRPHTGELLVARQVARDVVQVFRRLHAARFPIEQMRVISAADLDLPPTGDGNITSAFVCRATRGSNRWSEHAYGRAIDVNPFQNPYTRGQVLIPELATAYLDRSDSRPGMIFASGPAVRAFRSVGWTWGGQFRSLQDLMHFSSTGR